MCLIHETVNITDAEKAKRQVQESRGEAKEARAVADQQRIRLERFFEQAPAGCATLEGPELIFKMVNKAFQQLFVGRELLGLPLFEALPEIKNQPIAWIVQNVYNTGQTYEGKEVLIPVSREAGKPVEDVYWNFIYQATYDASGVVNGILIFALDVTSLVQGRQQAEHDTHALNLLNTELEERVEERTKEAEVARAEAERQQQRLENQFMNAPAAICILGGPDLVFELVNPGYQQLFPGRQLLGRPLLEALPEIEHNPVYRTFREVYETGATHEEYELLIPLARPGDGRLENRYFRFVQQARYNEQRQPDGVLVFAFEVTEQVEARKAAEESARQLRLLTDAMPVLIGYLDREERYRFANKAYKPWFNLDPRQLIGRKVREVVGERAYAGVKQYIDRALAGERLDFEASMPYREDFTRHIRTSYVPDVQNGEVLGFYTLVHDVTQEVEARKAVEKSEHEAKELALELAIANEELRLANLELATANQQLIHTNVDLDNFIYTASHDLRAPISNIEMLMAELLLELPQELQQQHEMSGIIGMMQSAIDRFKKTIANLTEITKLQKDNNSEVSLLNFGQIVEEVMLDLEPLIKESAAEVEASIEGRFEVSFSEKNLRSIVYNLLSNALKYRQPGRTSQVRLSCHEEGRFLVLAVRDNGLGLNTGQQQKLFTMFRRFHDHVEGTGVGLYMVKRMVDNAGGKIEVSSTAGEGSEFRVYFPLA